MKNCFFLLILIYFRNINSLIVLPFVINRYEPKKEGQVNVTDFINQYLVQDMFTDIEIGTPQKKVTTLITPDDSLLSLSSNICKRKSLDHINDLSIASKKGINLNSYDSNITNKNYSNYLNNENNVGIINEIIYLYNSTVLSSQPIDRGNGDNQNSKIDIKDVSIPIKDKSIDNNEKICGVFGIGSPLNIQKKLDNVPFFINFLKQNKIINDYNWSFKFYTKSEGRLIIGDLPHNYEDNKIFFNENKFITANSYSPSDKNHPWSFHFKEITFQSSNNETIYVGKWIKMIFVPNIGFIISEDKYKNLILDHYFKELIDKNICVLEKTNITKYTKEEIFFGTSGVYELFHCDKDLNKEKIVFPKLSFMLPDLENTFTFTFNDLFVLLDDRYYFLVIFPEDTRHAAYNVWYLGLPFYYPNRFVFNYDSKTIGIYNQKIKPGEKDSKDEENQNNNSDKKDGSSNSWRGVIEIIVVILFIFLVIAAYYFGKKWNEQRKRRANELNDNYDYNAGEEHNINGNEDNLINNNSNEKNSGFGF